MILVKNVENIMTGEIGELGLVGYRYTDEARVERKSDHRGLVVFFNNNYVKSFILTKHEVDLLVKYSSNIVQDLGYILSLAPTTLSIYDLASYFSKYDKQKGGYGLSVLATHIFELGFSEHSIESYTKVYNEWGLQLAVIEALKNLKETSYLVSRELHTPTQIFDFTKPCYV